MPPLTPEQAEAASRLPETFAAIAASLADPSLNGPEYRTQLVALAESAKLLAEATLAPKS